jgi:phytoene dehydrogenase-like protein
MIDATVVGSGPNGLAAALTLAKAGLEVRLVERAGTVGGGLRSSELTLPGFLHDVCSAVHPQALASPFFEAFGLREKVRFAIPEASYAHPLDGPHGPREAAIAYRDLDRTAAELGADGRAWQRLFAPLVDHLSGVAAFTQDQLLRVPRHPIDTLRYVRRVLEQGSFAAGWRFRDDAAPALFAGVAAHTPGGHPSLATAGTGLLLGANAHAAGWGVPVGGSQAIADAMAAEFCALGGHIDLGVEVSSPADLEPSIVTLLDTSPEFLARFAGETLPAGYRRRLRRFRRGPGIFKLDLALSGPVPWADPRVAESPTVHLGGTRREIASAEREVRLGWHPDRPYALVVQPSVVDPGRAPAGQHVLWSYSHVPAGSTLDRTDVMLDQLERFAPGVRDLVLEAVWMNAAEVEQNNPNDVGGDILGGAVTPWQLVRRPVVSTRPWRTPVHGLYLCSASTPPGPSVHGMCGWHAARLALREHFGVRVAPYSAAGSAAGSGTLQS